jgi:hypothetical protein
MSEPVEECWLDRAKELHHSGEWMGAFSAAMIGLLEWVQSDWHFEDIAEPDVGEVVCTDGIRMADEAERLVWDSQ